MSFQNYDSFPQQGQQGDVGAGPGGPPQQDQNMGGQIPPNSAGGFQGGNGGDPGSAGGQAQGGDAKTTLWYDAFFTLALAVSVNLATRSYFAPRLSWSNASRQSKCSKS